MFAIAAITVWRMREPAFMIMVLVGLIVSYWFAGLGTFNADFIGDDLLFGENSRSASILLGTILLVLLGALVAVFNAAAEIPRDVSSRMIAVLLAKPITRGRYIWGKFLGTLGLGGACSFLWISSMLLCRLFVVGADGEEPLGWMGCLQQYVCLLMLMPVTAMAIGISCYLSDILAMIVTSVYVVLCFVAALLPVVLALVGGFGLGKVLLIPYYAFPNLIYFLRSYDRPGDYLALGAYALCICIIFIGLGRARFDRGDLF